MDAILFCHHRGLAEPVTRKHYVLFKHLNPGCEVIPLSFEKGRETPMWQTQNHDVLLYEFFEATNPHYERYFLCEWDTFSTCSLKEFFGASYNKKVVGSQIVRPWSDELIESSADGFSLPQREWFWFRSNRSPELHPYLRGIVPASVVLFSHEALFNIVQLFKTVPAARDLQCECRMGTLAAMAGIEPEPIRPDCQRFISCRDVDIDQGPGVYHRTRV